MANKTMNLLYEGKAKRIFADPESTNRVIMEFKDSVTAGDGARKEEFSGKGIIACDISHLLFEYLGEMGIDTHYINRLEGPRLLCRRVKIIPIEVVCRNIAAGSFSKRYGIEKGKVFEQPFVEMFLKNDSLHDPLIASTAIVGLGILSRSDMEFLTRVTLSVNYYLSELLKQHALTLVDFKLEFGKTESDAIVLADELSPDSMRIWDSDSSSLDKDVFREDKGNLISVYQKMLDIIRMTDSKNIEPRKETAQVIVEPKKGIKNPTGEVTRKALIRLGFSEVEDVRAGRVYNVVLKKPITSDMLNHLNVMSVKLLSNPISERHHVRLE